MNITPQTHPMHKHKQPLPASCGPILSLRMYQNPRQQDRVLFDSGKELRKLSNLLRWTSHFFPGNQDTQTTYGQRHLYKGIYCNTIRGNNSLETTNEMVT